MAEAVRDNTAMEESADDDSDALSKGDVVVDMLVDSIARESLSRATNRE